MSIAALQPTAPAAPRPPAVDPKSDVAAVMTARSSVAGVTLQLLAAAAAPLQGQQVDAQA